MVVGSNVNPNYPIPGIDQSSKGFRDNFSTIKVELENLQGKNIVLQGDATGTATIDSGTGDVVINTIVGVANVAAATPSRSIQFNNAGVLGGNVDLVWTTNGTLVVGPQTPNTYYRMDAGRTKIHDALLVYSDVGRSNITIASSSVQFPTVSINSTSSNVAGMANINISNADTVTNPPLNIQFNNSTHAMITATGMAVGPLSAMSVASPTSSLSVYNNTQADIARFRTSVNNSDNGIRITTTAANSSAGFLLQQSAADSVVGIRVGSNGYFTIHTGLNNGANLNDSSQVVTINLIGQVGIGIPIPQARLDVDGNIQWTSPNSANPIEFSAGPVGTVVDSWALGLYRSADYTVQVTAPSGAVEITKLIVMHDAGVAYQYVYANLNTAAGNTGPTTLGTITADVNGGSMELTYAGNIASTIVKLDATYITI